MSYIPYDYEDAQLKAKQLSIIRNCNEKIIKKMDEIVMILEEEKLAYEVLDGNSIEYDEKAYKAVCEKINRIKGVNISQEEER